MGRLIKKGRQIQIDLIFAQSIDHCTVSVALLDVEQARRKLQQMYWILFNFQRR